jgi:hypothetical protein
MTRWTVIIRTKLIPDDSAFSAVLKLYRFHLLPQEAGELIVVQIVKTIAESVRWFQDLFQWFK